MIRQEIAGLMKKKSYFGKYNYILFADGPSGPLFLLYVKDCLVINKKVHKSVIYNIYSLYILYITKKCIFFILAIRVFYVQQKTAAFGQQQKMYYF